VEGPTDDPAVLQLRARQRRNLLATLLLSDGIPLLLGGDELGRTQGGNNNASCQDNPISWIDWAAADGEERLTDFVATLCRLRRDAPILHRTRFLAAGEVGWLRPDGKPMGVGDWTNPDARAVALAVPGARLLVNAWWQPLTFRLPGDDGWSVRIDTADATRGRRASGAIELAGRSLVLLGASR
jgi:isoamylase